MNAIDKLYAEAPEANMGIGGIANLERPAEGTYSRKLFDLIYTLMKYKRKVGVNSGRIIAKSSILR